MCRRTRVGSETLLSYKNRIMLIDHVSSQNEKNRIYFSKNKVYIYDENEMSTSEEFKSDFNI